jgi:hypothetical protein
VTTKEQVGPLDLSAARLTQREKGSVAMGETTTNLGGGLPTAARSGSTSRVVTLVRYPDRFQPRRVSKLPCHLPLTVPWLSRERYE